MKFNCIFQCLISSYLFFSSELYSLSEVQIISSAFLVHLFKLERLDSNDTSGMDSCTLDSKITRLSAHVDNPHHHHCHHHHHHHAKHGYPAYSHHDRFPPWWVFVRDDNGGNLSGDKIPPLMMIIINHLTQLVSLMMIVNHLTQFNWSSKEIL